MSKTAFLFPGQGSQTVGMGVDIASESEAAADVLLRIDNALDETLSLIMADGPADTLTLTQNAQPALFASSLGVLRALEAHTGTSASQIADYVAGAIHRAYSNGDGTRAAIIKPKMRGFTEGKISGRGIILHPKATFRSGL